MSEDGKLFKVCPMCGQAWNRRKDLLDDPGVGIWGYQVDFEDLVEGLFLFNHVACGTTFSLPVAAFRDLYSGPVFEGRRTGHDDCAGHCLRQGDLDPCPARCECAWVRHVIRIIRTWPRTSA